MGRVPDKATVKLGEVQTVLDENSLKNALDNSIFSYFDPLHYNENENNLRIFRNYGPAPNITILNGDGSVGITGAGNTGVGKTLTFDLISDAYRGEVTISSNVEWNLIDLGSSNISYSTTSGGVGNTTLIMFGSTSTPTEYPVGGTAIIRPNFTTDYKVFLSVRREGIGVSAPLELTIIPENTIYNISYHPVTFNVGIISNVSSYTISNNAAWLSTNVSSGGGSMTIQVSATQYNTMDIGVTRSGVITISGSGVSATINIVQNPRYIFGGGGSGGDVIDTEDMFMVDPGFTNELNDPDP